MRGFRAGLEGRVEKRGRGREGEKEGEGAGILEGFPRLRALAEGVQREEDDGDGKRDGRRESKEDDLTGGKASRDDADQHHDDTIRTTIEDRQKVEQLSDPTPSNAVAKPEHPDTEMVDAGPKGTRDRTNSMEEGEVETTIEGHLI